MFTIDIDTGGTFTDGFFTKDGEFKTVKVLTTAHDLTVCLASCIKEGAHQFGISVRELLSKTDVVRYSSTVGINGLITKTGSKIGLMVSKGYRESLYADDPEQAKALHDFIAEDMITEVEGEISEQGKVVRELNRDEVLSQMQYLIDSGARAIAVSLKNSHVNPTHENQIKQIIKEQYPSFYLGSVRVFLASEISDQPGNFYRTNAVSLNGYIHDSLVKYLYKAEDDLRANLHQRPLMVSHSTGGVARVAKTRAIDTFSSGPALGVIGARMVGDMYGCPNVLTVDIGGTSCDLGAIRDGSYQYSFLPTISNLPISVPMIVTYSAPLAGGSIANIDSSRNFRIGPQSAGARPGPACFDLGGLEPTVTDASVAMGFIDPDYFLGGAIKLNRARAVSAIKTKIADPLGISVDEAAHMIGETAEKAMKNEILLFLKDQDIGLEDLSGFAMLVYGGAGTTYCCGFSEGLSFSPILTSPYSSVFSAFGSSTTDLVHTYSKFARIELFDGSSYMDNYSTYNEIVNTCLEVAKRDIKGEGFSPEKALYFVELVGDEDLEGVRIKADSLYVETEKDIKALCSKFAPFRQGGNGSRIVLSTMFLNAAVPMPHFEVKTAEKKTEDPKKAFKGERNVFWSPEKGYQRTAVYERDLLEPGNVVSGPAIIEARDTTYVIPATRSFHLDTYSHGIIKEA